MMDGLMAESLVVDAEASGDVGAVVGEDDVGLLGETTDDIGGFGFGEVEGHGALAAVVGHEGPAIGGQDGLGVAPEVAPGRLDLDDAGAHIGKEHTRRGGGDHGGKFDDVDAVQGAGHGANPVDATLKIGVVLGAADYSTGLLGEPDAFGSEG